MFKRLENCEAPLLGRSEYIKVIPACMATEGGSKPNMGWECISCPAEVRTAVAAYVAHLAIQLNTNLGLVVTNHEAANEEA